VPLVPFTGSLTCWFDTDAFSSALLLGGMLFPLWRFWTVPVLEARLYWCLFALSLTCFTLRLAFSWEASLLRSWIQGGYLGTMGEVVALVDWVLILHFSFDNSMCLVRVQKTSTLSLSSMMFVLLASWQSFLLMPPTFWIWLYTTRISPCCHIYCWVAWLGGWLLPPTSICLLNLLNSHNLG